MRIHLDPFFSVFFGDAESALHRDFLMAPRSKEELWGENRILAISKMIHFDDLAMLKQIHSAVGIAVSDETLPIIMQSKPEGDFLVTDRLATGIAVYTADCLPIIAYDRVHHVLGICHAGWMGTVNNVVIVMLRRMQEEYGTDLSQLQIFLGPSAKSCCYEVTQEFTSHLENYSFKDQVLTERAGKLYFDIPLCNKMQLIEHGIKPEQSDLSYNTCTMCEGSYCSNRRQQDSKDRQLTIAVLNNKQR
jgi:YfiH family protein